MFNLVNLNVVEY